MSDSSGMSDSTTEPEEISTRLGYQCRFPVEVLKNILSFLASEVLDSVDQDKEDGSSAEDSTTRYLENQRASAVKRAPIAALRAIQQTSSAIYEVATPFLYRHLRVSSPQMQCLLDNFQDVGELRDVILQDRRDDVHPLDYHLYHRLQWALSFVREIHLVIHAHHRISAVHFAKYADICTALEVLDRPLPLAKPDKVTIRVGDMLGQHEISAQAYYCYPFDDALMYALGCTLYPTLLEVSLPTPPSNRHFHLDTNSRATASSSLRTMRADHVVLYNISHGSQGVPRANMSLALGFSPRCGKLGGRYEPTQDSALEHRLMIVEVQSGAPSLTLIGFERGLEDLPLEAIHAELDFVLLNPCRHIISSGDLVDPEDWDIWHTRGEPFAEHFNRSDIDAVGNDDDDEANDDAHDKIIDDIEDNPDAEQVVGTDAEPNAEAAFDLIQNLISAINANTTSADRRIDAVTREITTIAKTTSSTTNSMARLKLDMAAIKAMMKEMACKGKKGKKRSRIRRYKEKRISKKAGKRGGKPRKGVVG